MSGATREEALIQSISENPKINLSETLKAFGLNSLAEANKEPLEHIHLALNAALKTYGYQNGYNIYRYLKSKTPPQRGFCIIPADGKMIIFPPFSKKSDLGKEAYFAWVAKQIHSRHISIPDASSVEKALPSGDEEKAEETATGPTKEELIEEHRAALEACTQEGKPFISRENITRCWGIAHENTLPDELKKTAHTYLQNVLKQKVIHWSFTQHNDKYRFHFKIGTGEKVYHCSTPITETNLLNWLTQLSEGANFLSNIFKTASWFNHPVLFDALLKSDTEALTKLFQENRHMANTFINSMESTDMLVAFFNKLPKYCFNPELVAAQLRKWDAKTNPITAETLPIFCELLNASHFSLLKPKVTPAAWTDEYEALIPVAKIHEAPSSFERKKRGKKKKKPTTLLPLPDRLRNLQRAILDNNAKRVEVALEGLNTEELMALDQQYPLINKALLQWHYRNFENPNAIKGQHTEAKKALNKINQKAKQRHHRILKEPEELAMHQIIDAMVKIVLATLPKLLTFTLRQKEQQANILNQLINRGCSVNTPIHKNICALLFVPITEELRKLKVEEIGEASEAIAAYHHVIYTHLMNGNMEALNSLTAPQVFPDIDVMIEHLLGFMGREDLIQTLFQNGLDPSRSFTMPTILATEKELEVTALHCLQDRVPKTRLATLFQYFPKVKNPVQLFDHIVMNTIDYSPNPAVASSNTYYKIKPTKEEERLSFNVGKELEAFEPPLSLLKLPCNMPQQTGTGCALKGSRILSSGEPLLFAILHLEAFARVQAGKSSEELKQRSALKMKQDIYFADEVVPLLMRHGADPFAKGYVHEYEHEPVHEESCLAHCQRKFWPYSVNAILEGLDLFDANVRKNIQRDLSGAEITETKGTFTAETTVTTDFGTKAIMTKLTPAALVFGNSGDADAAADTTTEAETGAEAGAGAGAGSM